MTAKIVESVEHAPPPHWVGDGFHVRPLFARKAFTHAVSPFLMLDYAAPTMFPPRDKPAGVGPHPHRGFETVTIVYAGEVEHRDSAGHEGKIGEAAKTAWEENSNKIPKLDEEKVDDTYKKVGFGALLGALVFKLF